MTAFRSYLSDLRLWVCNFVIAFIPSHCVRLAYYRHVMNFDIGRGASVHIGCHFACAGGFSLGLNSTVNQFCHLDNRGGLHIGVNVSVSPRGVFITADHDIYRPTFCGRTGTIRVEDHAFIGYGAVHLPGIVVARGSVIGASALVTKSTEAFGVYYGVPATKQGVRPQELHYETSYRRLFH